MSHKMHFPQYLSDNTCVGVTAQHEGNTFLSKRGKTGVQIQSMVVLCKSVFLQVYHSVWDIIDVTLADNTN